MREKAEGERKRSDYLRVINAYQRVYLITPKTPYADNALLSVGKLYAEIQDARGATRAFEFLLREYPTSPLRRDADLEIAKLASVDSKKVVLSTPAALENRPSAAASASVISVDNVRYWEAPNSVRVVVDVGAEVTFSQGEARSPDRVFVDIRQARLSPALVNRQWPVKLGILEQVRVGQFDGNTVRVVLDVVKLSRVTTFTLKEPHRLIIDVLGESAVARTSPPVSGAREPARTGEVPAVSPEPPPSTASVLPTEKESTKGPEVPSAAAAGSEVEPRAKSDVSGKAEKSEKDAPAKDAAAEAVVKAAKPTSNGDRSLIRSLGLKISRVILDPGHGGHDTGSIGPTGFSEKELVLDVAQRLKKQIESELGAEVIMTRTDDTFVPLETRTAMANQNEADLFLSIHANSSRLKSVRGVETFFLNLTSSKEALETASRENAASTSSVHELQDIVKKIMLRDKVDESREFATHVQKALSARRGSGTNRGVKQAPFVVLIGANMPSVLAEVAFISHPQEEKSVKSAKVRQDIADALFEGVRSYAETLSGIRTARAQDKADRNPER